ncbi:MAG: YhdP family protein [Comamonas sp.]
MIDPNLSPSRQLRFFARIARWSLALVLAFWLLLFAVWGALHGFIVPRIGDWRAHVERLATQAIGVPVQIGELTARSEGLFPTIELRDVRILDAHAQPALQLPRVVVTISPRSVLRMGLEQLYVDAPQLDVRRLADGQWQIGGMALAPSGSSDHQALEWLLEQPELVIRQGAVRFTDEKTGHPTVQWQAVDVLARHRNWHHVLRIDATPQNGVSERLHLVGAFKQPLLPSRQAPWQRWSGQWFAQAQLHNVPALPWPASWGIASIQAHGASRVWLDVEQGRVVGLTADVAMPHAQLQWSNNQQPPLQLQALQARVDADWQDQSWRVRAERFSFMQPQGQRWPESQWELRRLSPQGQPQMRLALEHADLQMAATLAQALPLPAPWKHTLQRWQPQGQVQALQAQWSSAEMYQASGRMQNLSLAAQPGTDEHTIGIPGVEQLQLHFQLNQHGGQARLQMQDGAAHFPGVFEEPRVPLERLTAELQWTTVADAIQVQVKNAQFANADTEGQLHGNWETSGDPAQRLPGRLNLQGRLERADGARVHRYLPTAIPADARHYVRDSVLAGEARNVRFEVRGDLQHMPFTQPEQGRFWIEADVSKLAYDYVPERLLAKGHTPWPGLRDLSGTLVFDGVSMYVRQAQTAFDGFEQLRMAQVEAHIPNLNAPQVLVQAQGTAPLANMLHWVRQSPVAAMTEHALDKAQAQGMAQLQLHLDLPIAHLERSVVEGHVGFDSNRLQFVPTAPTLYDMRGGVRFHSHGFELQRVSAQALGGPVQLSGGMASAQEGVRIHAQGTASAMGLQRDAFLPWLEPLAQHMQGQTAYAVEVQASQGQQSVTVQSSLQGWTLALPEPLHKRSDDAWPLHIRHIERQGQPQELEVRLGDRVHTSLALQSDGALHAGTVRIGNTTALTRPAQGLAVQVQTPRLDLDAWLALLPATPQDESSSNIAAQPPAWLPRQVHWQVDQLRWKQRELHALEGRMEQRQGIWHGWAKAPQLEGRFELHPASLHSSQGKLVARLSRLHIPQAEALRLNEAEPSELQSPDSLPALDIEVDDLHIGTKVLGALQLQARNRRGNFGPEWMLDRFVLQTPEARWNAEGVWGRERASGPRRTALSFALDMNSSGSLLESLGLPDVIRDGQGKLDGHIAWQGSPILPDWKSMDGAVHMQVDKGQFLKVEPGMGKLLSVLSLQSLARRVTLDFRDVFSQGFAFDFIRGDIRVQQGVATTNNLQMKGLNAAVLMEGLADLAHETQDIRVVVVPEINAMTASLVATAINPVVGLGSFLAQMFLRGPLMEAATRHFHVHGSWSDPVVEPVAKREGDEPSFAPMLQ